MLKRKIEEKLKEWKQARKTALLVERATWWLRSPCNNDSFARYVRSSGRVYNGSVTGSRGVRSAMRIKYNPETLMIPQTILPEFSKIDKNDNI